MQDALFLMLVSLLKQAFERIYVLAEGGGDYFSSSTAA